MALHYSGQRIHFTFLLPYKIPSEYPSRCLRCQEEWQLIPTLTSRRYCKPPRPGPSREIYRNRCDKKTSTPLRSTQHCFLPPAQRITTFLYIFDTRLKPPTNKMSTGDVSQTPFIKNLGSSGMRSSFSLALSYRGLRFTPCHHSYTRLTLPYQIAQPAKPRSNPSVPSSPAAAP